MFQRCRSEEKSWKGLGSKGGGGSKSGEVFRLQVEMEIRFPVAGRGEVFVAKNVTELATSAIIWQKEDGGSDDRNNW